ncbi:MAG TPA: DUF3014 domain-containing protein [Polyangia bacterium]|nr:DUF3014 domain-containing protein [Polyangia bacterium]
MSPLAKFTIALLVAAGIGGGIYYWYGHRAPPAPPAAPAVKPAAPTPPAAPPPDAAPAIQNPLETKAEGLPPLSESDEYVRKLLLQLLGKKGLAFILTGDFIRHCVSTVDSLANEKSNVMMWPVNQTAGRFQTEAGPAGTVIADRNDARYAAFVLFVEAVDARKAAALYRRLYPLFQQAYEELGYPGRYFNDRLVEVIDHLLATPDVPRPIKVKQVEVPGVPKPVRPLYQYEDPALEKLSAGQKILLRVGSAHAARFKAKLNELRRQVARGPGRAQTAQ